MKAPCDPIEIDEAYRRGDLEAVKARLGDPPDLSNCRGPYGGGEINPEYAIHYGPLAPIAKALGKGCVSPKT